MSTTRVRRRTGLGRGAALAAAAVLLFLPWTLDLEGLGEPGHRMLGLFLAAIVLWVSEAIPLHATAAFIILFEIVTISDRALWALPADFDPPAYSTFLGTLAHPVLMLFLGGFFLAEGAAKFHLDRALARILLRPFGTSPRRVLLGLMVVTAVFSMFMSNTATTATVLAVVLPVAVSLDRSDRFRTALVLAIPVAANIGGMGTPVGTPPNAIAVGSLAEAGYDVGFGEWMVLAVPVMSVVLVLAWLLLLRVFPARTDAIRLEIEGALARGRDAAILYTVFVATVVLWLSEPLHGVNANIVGFLPVVVLLATRVFSAEDLQRIPWHVLWLVAGGIALGIGVTAAGLDTWLVARVDWSAMSGGMVVAGVAATALLLSTFISNSAAANLLIPIGLTLALSGAVSVEAVAVAFFIAVGASLAMALPVSTPPNALAYSTGMVTTRQMAAIGAVVGIAGWALFVWLAPIGWSLMGVSPG